MRSQNPRSLVDRSLEWLNDLSSAIERIREEFDSRIAYCQDIGEPIKDYEKGLLCLLDEFDDIYQWQFVNRLAELLAEGDKS